MTSPTVFISYSHKDEAWKDRLVTHLSVLQQEGILDLWDDRRIGAGGNWYQKIEEAIARASVAVLLVSADFLTSKFILSKEIPDLLERRDKEGLRIFPVIIKPCAWKHVKWLARMSLRPKDGRPIQGGSKFQVETDLTAIAEAIADIIGPTMKMPKKEWYVPLDPEKISLAKLPYTNPELFGRDKELKMLDELWDNTGTNIISLVAWGGVGKTALVNSWLSKMSQDNFRGAERVFGWSFYSQGAAEGKQASADQFIASALKWFGDLEPDAGSPWEKGERLAEYIRKQKTLLILDGLERMQHAFGENVGRIRDPGLQSLVRELANNNPGLCVITTRLDVDDLKDFSGTTVANIHLESLSDEAGMDLLKYLGVKGTDDELKQAVRDFDGHALALILLGTYLSIVYKGDVKKRDRIAKLTKEKKYGGHAIQVMESYEIMFKDQPELDILRIMGLFDRPAESGAIDVLRAAPPIKGLTTKLTDLSHEDWQFALNNLIKAGLLANENPSMPDTLDCHPLVREHFGDELRENNPEAWKEAHYRLYEYFRHPDTADTVPTHPDEPAKLDQLGRKAFARALAKRLRRIRYENLKSDHAGAFLMHIHGSWGSGKTSLLNFLQKSLSDPEYLFSWDEIPGNDSDKFRDFLIQNFSVTWVRNAKIEKIDKDKTICVSTENNSLLLRLNDRKNKVFLTINDIIINEFIVKMEESKLNLYHSQWIVVNFNAWQHQRIGPPWWSLMDAVYRGSIQQMVGRKRVFNLKVREWKWRLTTGRLSYYVTFAFFIWVLTLLVWIIFPNFIENTPSMQNIALSVQTLSMVIAILVTIWGLFLGISRSLLPGSARAARTFMESTNDPLQHLSHHFEDLVNWIVQPMVIFIDDLDRCQLKYTIELLEGIQTLFRKAPVMYVVAADRRWLCTSYEKFYAAFSGTVQEPGRPLSYLFLEKTFQLSVSLPRLSPDVQKQYWQHLIQIEKPRNMEEVKKAQKDAKQRLQQLKKEEDILAEIPRSTKNPIYEQAFREEAVIRLATPEVEEHTEHTLKDFAPLLEPNPRAMKRLVNAYSVQRDIVILSGSNIELKKLALWTILCMRWPLLAEYLQDHPEMIKHFGKDTLPVPDNKVSMSQDLQELFQDTKVVEVIEGEINGKRVGTSLDEDAIRIIIGLRTADSKERIVA